MKNFEKANIDFLIQKLFFCSLRIWKGETLHEKCPYSEFFWSVFPHIYTEYGDLLFTSPYSVRIRESTD